MGVKISGTFKGGLAMAMTHDMSKVMVMTDPPLDNGGEGKSFSPTDLMATSLGACMMSMMAIYAKKEKFDLTGMACSVEKHMSADLPRRIAALDAVIIMPTSLTPDQRETLERIGNTCPIILSIHPDIKLTKLYKYEA